MDILTHFTLGAAGAAALAPSKETRWAALAGGLAGLLPDADALIESAADPLLNLEFHRHFSHALTFVPVGALIASALLWLVMRRHLTFPRLYGYCLIGYLLAPLLDACTSYGTHLLWPFSDQPVAWSIIPIVDPLFTLAVLIPLAFALVCRHSHPARWSLGLAALYLTAGLAQHERALVQAQQLAASRDHAPERLLVKPTIGNLILWRSVYVYGGDIHVDGIRVALPGSSRAYAGERAPLLDPERDLPGLKAGSVQHGDLERFVRFADGLPIQHPRRDEFIGDARYAMLPTRIEPLWGIVLNFDAPEHHARFETNRRFTPEVRREFLDMLLGRELKTND